MAQDSDGVLASTGSQSYPFRIGSGSVHRRGAVPPAKGGRALRTGIDSKAVMDAARLQFAGEMLQARLSELAARPHPDKCELVIRDLDAARRLVADLRDQLLGEGLANR
jgi:hypothetical protein